MTWFHRAAWQVTGLSKWWKLNENKAINKASSGNVTRFVYVVNYFLQLTEVIRFPTFLFPTTSLCDMLCLCNWVPGRQRQRNGYVTALRCPGIYLIISLNEVGEAPKPLGLQTTFICIWLPTTHPAWSLLMFFSCRNQTITHTAISSRGALNNNSVGLDNITPYNHYYFSNYNNNVHISTRVQMLKNYEILIK